MNAFLTILIVALVGLALVILWRSPRAVNARRSAIRRRAEYFASDGRIFDADTFLIQCEWLHLISIQDAAKIRSDLLLRDGS